MFGAMIGFVVLWGVLAILMIIAGWMIIAKSGQPGVAIIVPIWNYIAILKAASKPWWWLFLFFIPLVNIVFLVMMLHGLSLNFGKSTGFTVGLVFLFPVFWMILGFGGKYAATEKSATTVQS